MPPEQDGCQIGQQLPERISGRQVRHLVGQHGLLLPGVEVVRKARRNDDDRAQKSKRNRGCQPGRRQDLDTPPQVQTSRELVDALLQDRLTDTTLPSAKTL